MAEISQVKLPSDECHWTLLMVSKSTWRRYATSHHLGQYWPILKSLYGVTGPLSVNSIYKWCIGGHIYTWTRWVNIIFVSVYVTQWLNTSRPRQMTAISHTTFSHAFPWMKMGEFRLEFRWSLFLGLQLTIFHIGADNGLAPIRRQAIIWTNAGILLTGPLGRNLFKKMHLKMSSLKCWPFCLSLNVLMFRLQSIYKKTHPYPAGKHLKHSHMCSTVPTANQNLLNSKHALTKVKQQL